MWEIHTARWFQTSNKRNRTEFKEEFTRPKRAGKVFLWGMALFDIYDNGKEFRVEAETAEAAAQLHGKQIGAAAVNLAREMPNGTAYYTASIRLENGKGFNTRAVRIAPASSA